MTTADAGIPSGAGDRRDLGRPAGQPGVSLWAMRSWQTSRHFWRDADLPAWIARRCKLLLTPEYQNYLLVSGRGGLVTHDQVRAQLEFLEMVTAQLGSAGGPQRAG